MKKFSKLIIERIGRNPSQDKSLDQSLFINPVDWDEVFKPLIDHITGDLVSDNRGPGNSVFSDETLSNLKSLMTSVNKDYKEYFQEVVYDGSQEHFLGTFKINVKHEEIFDCIQSIMDNADETQDIGDFQSGTFVVEMSDFSYREFDEFFSDILDTHSKLEMLQCDYLISIKTKINNSGGYSQVNLFKGDKNHSKKENWDRDIVNKLSNITIIIYNKQTLQSRLDVNEIRGRNF